ncbi:MAG: HD domain-containing protein [Desulfovibrionaceae bacterium]|jgi:tRNA nucleotidyltransferase (CCA-adding enzyme)|nr:HD domain-containing protein [Desulfovibrionaceae bacterium]
MDVYLVGGAVRDMLLGRAVRERDYLFLGGDCDAFVAAHPGAHKVGRCFPIVIHRSCEFAPPRGASLRDDLLHRDLTINALAMDARGVLHCHPRALGDLRDGVLRPARPESLEEDPLRVLRAARFAAVFPGFSTAPELLDAMRAAGRAGLLNGLSAERVGGELLKALAAPRPGRFVRVLAEAGCLAPWFRELAEAAEIPAGPPQYHARSVLGHIAEVMDRLAGDPLRVYMGLAHDLGKTLTPRDMLPHHYGHEKAGEPVARELGLRLRLSNRYVDAGALAAALHMTAGRYPALRPGTRVDLLDRLHRARLFAEMFDLVAADANLGRSEDGEGADGVNELDRGKDSVGQGGSGGADWRAEASEDMAALLAVRLPRALRRQGPESGRILRELRCRVLAQLRAARAGVADAMQEGQDSAAGGMSETDDGRMPETDDGRSG